MSAALLALSACAGTVQGAADRASTANQPAVWSASAGPSGSGLPSPRSSPSVLPRLSPSTAPPAPSHFSTLPPGAKLPSGAQCAQWVHAHPIKEIKASNKTANHTTGTQVSSRLFDGDSSAAKKNIAPRIDGDFTGTTQEILRWGACKWGIDENIVYAQAVMESWWRQSQLGTWGSDASACPPGHGIGADGKAGQCPQSFGLLQVRWVAWKKIGWPALGKSSAMGVDMAYAIWRSCFDGYQTWLNYDNNGHRYKAGDAWGCVGSWYSGHWYNSAATGYISDVKKFESSQYWKRSDFKEM